MREEKWRGRDGTPGKPGFLGGVSFAQVLLDCRMKLIFAITVLGLLGTACSDSSEASTDDGCTHGEGVINYKMSHLKCGRPEDHHPKRQVPQPGAPPLPLVAPGPPGSCGARRMKKTKLNPDWKRIMPHVPGLPVDTFYGEAPWLVRILADGKFVCGGTLVNPQAVLTAAHCLNDEKVRLWEVEVGEWNASSQIEPNPPQRQTAATVVVHKDFNHLNSANNIAMIFVQEPFALHETVGIMCLADSLNMINPKSCLAAGWGKDGQGRGYEYSPVLRKTNLPVLPNDKCQEKLRTTALGDRFELMNSFVCAGGIDKRDTCQGDGGGPLYCETRENQIRYALYGIIAWGIGCGETNPTVFSSVPYHYDWIIKNLEKHTS